MLPCLHEREDVHALTLSSSVSQPDTHCFLLERAKRNSPLQQADSHQRNAYASQHPDFYFCLVTMTQNYCAKDMFDSSLPLLSQDPSFTENTPPPPSPSHLGHLAAFSIHLSMTPNVFLGNGGLRRWPQPISIHKTFFAPCVHLSFGHFILCAGRSPRSRSWAKVLTGDLGGWVF